MSNMQGWRGSEEKRACDTIPREVAEKIDQATRGMSEYERVVFKSGFSLGQELCMDTMQETLRALRNAKPHLFVGTPTVRK